MLAGRGGAAGPELGDADVLLGVFQARSGYLLPLTEALRQQFDLRVEIRGNVVTAIPAGTVQTYDPTVASATERGSREVRRGGARALTFSFVDLEAEYLELCRLRHLSQITPRLRDPGGDHDPCKLIVGIPDFIGFDLQFKADEIDVRWTAPEAGDNNTRNPVLQIAIPAEISSGSLTYGIDLLLRAQVEIDTDPQRVRFASYRHADPALGDAQFSDAGVALHLRVTHRNFTGPGEFAGSLDGITRIIQRLLDRAVHANRLDGATATSEAWREWCNDRFGSCPLTSLQLGYLADGSLIEHGETLIALPPRSDDPTSDPRAFAAEDGVWTNNTIHAIAEGASVTSATFTRDHFQDRCGASYAAECTGPGRNADCAVCDFCATPRTGFESLCDFRAPFTMTRRDGSRINALSIPASPNVARLMDYGPNLGLELYRLFNEPVDRYRARTGEPLKYADALWCNSGVPAECPAFANGATFFLDSDYDGDGVNAYLDNCPEYNPDQRDSDGDGLGDRCDRCELVAGGATTDRDGDGTPDGCDCDIDGDGCNNEGPARFGGMCERTKLGETYDQRPTIRGPVDWSGAARNTDAAFKNGDPFVDDCDLDDDADGVPDTVDNCRVDPNSGQEDSDHNGRGDACDVMCPATGCSTVVIDEGGGERIEFWGHSLGIESPELCLVDAGRGCMIYWLVEQDDLVLRGGDTELARVSAKQLGLPGFGGAAALVPDLDGDGYDDVAVASPHATVCMDIECKKSTGVIVGIGSANGDVLFEVSPLGIGAELGTALARVDGELWAGAPGQLDATGERTGAVVRLHFRDGKPAIAGVLFGEAKGERFGEYLRVLDGERVAIAAPGVGAGRFDLFARDGHHVGRIDGPGEGAGIGSRIAAIDVAFGDGALLLAWPAHDSGRGLVELRDASGTKLWAIEGDEGQWFGMSLVAPADYDGDGVAHALVGVPGYNSGQGAILAITSTGKAEKLVLGVGGGFGSSISSPGDLDGDGHPDFTAAMPEQGLLLHYRGAKK